MATQSNRPSTKRLREYAHQAWEAELHLALNALLEEFYRWQDGKLNAFDLVERIHHFHDGGQRELYRRYAQAPPGTALAQAVARHIVNERDLPAELIDALRQEIDYFRLHNDSEQH